MQVGAAVIVEVVVVTVAVLRHLQRSTVVSRRPSYSHTYIHEATSSSANIVVHVSIESCLQTFSASALHSRAWVHLRKRDSVCVDSRVSIDAEN